MDLTLDVRPISAVMDEIPEGARVSLTDMDIARIRGLAGLVQALDGIYGNVYGVEFWDASPRWQSSAQQDESEAGCDMDAQMLHVTVDEFYWTAYVHHSDTQVETVPVLIKDLQIPDRPEATALVAV